LPERVELVTVSVLALRIPAAAAFVGGGIAAYGGVGQRKRAGAGVEDPAAIVGSVAAYGGIASASAYRR
jgi:hypothetical protein